LAEKRHGYTLLPKKQFHSKVFENTQNKLSLLRDVCLNIGVVLSLKKETDLSELILENDSSIVRKHFSNLLSHKNNANQSNKKKGVKPQTETTIQDSEIFVYENLPFKPNHIGDFFAITKRLEYHNRDSNYLVQ
jgi:hypothetical protein